MGKAYTNPIYEYDRSPDQFSAAPTHHPVIIVGAGPAGLSAAIDLAVHGISAVVLDDNNTVSVGSRAICFSKRSLEICDRYGPADRMLNKGITWNLGKVYWQDDLVYEFNLLPEENHKFPAFVNIQQYYFEEYMVDRCLELPSIDLRWLSKVSNVRADDDKTTLDVTTEDGTYALSCDYLLVADGASSPIRTDLGLPFNGQVFQDHFLIADILMKAEFPSERRFWFDAPFHPNQSTLLHKQADNVWRIDFQLGWDTDLKEEAKAENVIPRVRAMLGDDIEFEVEWTSVYTFRCRKMDSFIHKHILFIGDAAHQVSPFGARGGNGAIQGVDNLAWKLANVLKNKAPKALLKTYDLERQRGADENIMHSTRSTDFMTPKNSASRAFQHAVLEMASRYPFAQSLVNSGRLSTPCAYIHSPLNTMDNDQFEGGVAPGTVSTDAPLIVNNEQAWLLSLLGNHFVCLVDASQSSEKISELASLNKDIRLILVNPTASRQSLMKESDVSVFDQLGVLISRYDLLAGTTYLIRPDQYVCARWKGFEAKAINSAYLKALGHELEAD